MTVRNSRPLPFGPILVAGLAAPEHGHNLLQPLLSLAATAMARRHPQVFTRLAEAGSPSFLIDPVDLPFAFLLETEGGEPRLSAQPATLDPPPTATIRGPLLDLLDLLEGRVDGDALFFSRDLEIEGSTEAVVALRNAVDSAEITLTADLPALFGPLARPAEYAMLKVQDTLARAVADLETLQRSLLAPLIRRSDAQAGELAELRQRLEKLENQARRKARRET